MAFSLRKVPFRSRNSSKSAVFDRLLTDLDTRIVNFGPRGPEIGDSGSADRSCRGFPKGVEIWENAWQSDELSVLWHLLGRYCRHLPAACNIITGIHASSLLSSQRKKYPPYGILFFFEMLYRATQATCFLCTHSASLPMYAHSIIDITSHLSNTIKRLKIIIHVCMHVLLT